MPLDKEAVDLIVLWLIANDSLTTLEYWLTCYKFIVNTLQDNDLMDKDFFNEE